MPTKRVKTTATDDRVARAEAAAGRIRNQLRRLERTHRRIGDLSRRVTRLVQAADTSRVVAARALLEGTDYTPVFVPQLEQDAKDLDDARNTIAAAATEYATLTEDRDHWKATAAYRLEQLNALTASAAGAGRE
jgi:CO/xanthine dehydrogenase FAD-binding subunit